MKRILSLSILLLCLCVSNIFAVGGNLGGGDGSETSPYLIQDLDDFNEFTSNSGYWDTGKYTHLETDLDLVANGTYSQAPIGGDIFNTEYYDIGPGKYLVTKDYDGVPYSGVFDGGNHKISNLSILGNFYCGLFGKVVSGGSISNLNLENYYVLIDFDQFWSRVPTYNSDFEYFINIGGLVGHNENGIITNCEVQGSIDIKSAFYRNVGGLVGLNEGNITESVSTCSVIGYSDVGGLVGYNERNCNISLSSSNCTVVGVGGSFGVGGVGGLTGFNYGNISECSSTGTVNGEWNIGGLVGSNDSNIYDSCSSSRVIGSRYNCGGLVGRNIGHIYRSYSTGDVNGAENTGGLSGYCMGNIYLCYSSSTVEGTNYVGGLLGRLCLQYVKNCYSTGAVTGTGIVGGLIGGSDGEVENSYSTGVVIGSSDTGGLVGKANIDFEDCFWDVETSGLGSSGDNNYGATGKMTAEMQDISTFLNAGWDFVGESGNGTDDIWLMDVYPVFAMQEPQKPLFPDINGDSCVDIIDFALMSQRWLDSDCLDPGYCSMTDLDKSGQVDINDLIILSNYWLYCIGNPVAIWNFNEADGIVANDLSGNDNYGLLTSGASFTGDGKLSLDGINDYVLVPDSSSLDITDEITLSVRLYMYEYSATSDAKVIVKPYDMQLSDPWELYTIDMGTDGKCPRFIISEGTPGSWNGVYDSSLELNTGQWYHIAGTYDGATMKLYVDGALIASHATSIDIGTNDMPLCIGSYLGQFGFKGLIDDVRIFDTVLDGAQIGLLCQE